LVHINKIIPKKKRKGGERKKDGYENSSKIFLHPKEKDICVFSPIIKSPTTVDLNRPM
jgi:hypothetical protein